MLDALELVFTVYTTASQVPNQTDNHPFNGLFSRTTWVRYSTRKVKPIWTLTKQEMTGWQWHQLEPVQIICTLLQTDNHASTSSLNFVQAGCSF